MKILITSGGTKVPIDGVRDITNMSHGTFGAKICRELLDLTVDSEARIFYLGSKDGCRPFKMDVDFSEDVPQFHTAKEDYRAIHNVWEFLYWAQGVRHRCVQHYYRTYNNYAAQLEVLVRTQQPEIVILAAAVSDYVVKSPISGKVRSSESLEIQLQPAEKLISRIKEWAPKCKLVGFKLLVNSTEDELIAAAKKSIESNGCDLVVANDLRDIKANNHKLILVEKNTCSYHQTRGGDPNYDGNPNYLARVVAENALALCGTL